MAPPGIIAFAKDWHEDPTSNHHVLRELAKSRRVLWLNSIGTRTPKLSSGRDLGKIRRKLVELAKGPVNVENDLWVFTPVVLPFPHSAVARRLNQGILRASIAMLQRRLGMRDFHLWTFLPNVADYVGIFGESLSVYYCVDEWSLFAHLDKEETVRAERALLDKVDCVFAINEELAKAKRAHVAPHGVEHAVFARALDASTTIPAEIASLPRPILGFYGTLRDWVDLELLAGVARSRPSWSIVLLGQQLDDMSALAGLPNVHLLGRKPHSELPAYCKGFDVGLIPYRLEERMKFVNPIKLREYLSAGLPVVSTPVPEVLRFGDVCHIARTPEEVIAAVQIAVKDDSQEKRRRRSEAMKSETWAARVASIVRIVDDTARLRPSREPK